MFFFTSSTLTRQPSPANPHPPRAASLSQGARGLGQGRPQGTPLHQALDSRFRENDGSCAPRPGQPSPDNPHPPQAASLSQGARGLGGGCSPPLHGGEGDARQRVGEGDPSEGEGDQAATLTRRERLPSPRGRGGLTENAPWSQGAVALSRGSSARVRSGIRLGVSFHDAAGGGVRAMGRCHTTLTRRERLPSPRGRGGQAATLTRRERLPSPRGRGGEKAAGCSLPLHGGEGDARQRVGEGGPLRARGQPSPAASGFPLPGGEGTRPGATGQGGDERAPSVAGGGFCWVEVSALRAG